MKAKMGQAIQLSNCKVQNMTFNVDKPQNVVVSIQEGSSAAKDYGIFWDMTKDDEYRNWVTVYNTLLAAFSSKLLSIDVETVDNVVPGAGINNFIKHITIK
ncbi:hypothetical protein [Photorhabdus cinerea]|uniref:Uncharacterized protein n=1 Tax=Photorhabdus cinerea TaxID=471575 RepID=A0A7X5QFD3_9GAMM|nr:hypothetical protein [Photorhabdus cinerea]NHB93403.1 hypothetical protein [Photorhabdus cinerea]